MDAGRAIDAWATVTHARLRAAQGDFEEARRILRAVLSLAPDDAEAKEALESIADRAAATRDDPEPAALDAPVPARAGDLAASFRAALASSPSPRGSALARLERFARRLERTRGGRRGLR